MNDKDNLALPSAIDPILLMDEDKERQKNVAEALVKQMEITLAWSQGVRVNVERARQSARIAWTMCILTSMILILREIMR